MPAESRTTTMAAARRLAAVLAVLGVAGCGLVGGVARGREPGPVPSAQPLPVQTAMGAGTVPPVAPAAVASAGRVAPAGAPATVPALTLPSDPGTAILNARLLGQVGPPSGDADLPIGPGDLIEVSVFEVEELSKLKLRVPIRGAITLPLLGSVPAAGRSAIELEDDIRARLRQRYMHDPQVSVFVHEHNSQRITVLGAVRRGGVFTLTRPFRLADALALAEGLADDADHAVYVIRRVPAGTVVRTAAGVAPNPTASVPPLPGQATEEVMVRIDLEALAGGQQEFNVALHSGDVIHVPRAGSVYVGGSVERPGSYALKGRMTVHQVILAAGGVKDVADWEDVRLYRATADGQREVQGLDLRAFEAGQPPPELRQSDVVVVGKSSSKAFWYGFLDVFKAMFGISKGF